MTSITMGEEVSYDHRQEEESQFSSTKIFDWRNLRIPHVKSSFKNMEIHPLKALSIEIHLLNFIFYLFLDNIYALYYIFLFN